MAYVSQQMKSELAPAIKTILKKALGDKAWMAQNGDRPVVKAMATYLDARDQIAFYPMLGIVHHPLTPICSRCR